MQGSIKEGDKMKKLKGKVSIIVEKTDTGFSCYSEKYGICTTGKTIPELIENSFEATTLFFEHEGIEINHSDLQFNVDFHQFFQHYKVLNSKYLAEKIGMNSTLLSQYVQGHKKPSESQTEKILLGIHQIGQELSELNLIYRH